MDPTDKIVAITQIHLSDLTIGELKYSTKIKVSLKVEYESDEDNEKVIKTKEITQIKTVEEVYLLCLKTSYKIPDEIKTAFEDYLIESVSIHVRLQQRTTRKFFTICEGLPPSINYERILKALRQGLKCNGHLSEDKSGNKIVQLQGNHVKNVADFFVINSLCHKDKIVVHGI
jgi:translation initiation factor SUI1